MRKLFFLFIISLLSLSGSAQTEVDGLWYDLNNDTAPTATVTSSQGEIYSGEIVIPSTITVDGVTYTVNRIEGNAFSGSYITRIELPASLTSIGDYAFNGCENLVSVVSHIRDPFAVTKYTFSYRIEFIDDTERITPSYATLYVPEGTLATYQSAAGWDMFSTIYEGEPQTVTIDGINYLYATASKTAIVINGDYSSLTTLTIPGTIEVAGENYTVKSIGSSAFRESNLESLIISSGVEVIGNWAFGRSWNLKELELPSTLRSIGDYAFDNCYNINSIIIPNGVTKIGSFAFWACHSARVIELPATISELGADAFANCSGLTTVISRIRSPFMISKRVFALTWNSYWDSEQQKTVYEYTPSDASLYVPEGTLAAYQALEGWDMFAAIYEGEPLETTINGIKYQYVTSARTAKVIADDYYQLTEVVIPSTITIDGANYQVKEIGASAFKGCYNLNSVSLNNGIERIGDMAFSGCPDADFGVLPSTVRYIGDQAFYNCNAIKELELPEGLQTIGANAFATCYGLKKAILPSTLKEIGRNVFYDCHNLAIVISRIQDPFEIAKNVFGRESWENNSNEPTYTPCGARLYVPEGSLAKYQAIEGWTMFAAIYEGEVIEATVGDLTYSYNTSSKVAMVVKGDHYSELHKAITVPSTVTIDGVVCEVKEIASLAFSGAPILSIDFEPGVEIIGQEAFRECRQLSNVSFPSTLKHIYEGAFGYCNSLKSLAIPASLTDLGEMVFSGCTGLESIEVAEGNTVYESRGSNAIIEKRSNTLLYGCKNTVIPSSVVEIGKEAFFGCEMKTIQIPGSVKKIGHQAFSSCSNLTEVKLPEGLENIDVSAFGSCEQLVTIEIPSSIKRIEEWAFAWCRNLQNVVTYIESPEAISDNVFGENYQYSYESTYSRATLWVPKGRIDAYKRVDGWKNFQKYDEMLGDVLTKPTITYNGRYMTMTNDASQKANIYYSIDGSEPTILYSDTVALSNLGTIQAISKRIGSFTVDTASYKVDYIFDGVTARTASGGLLKNAFEWCGTDKVELLDIDGQLNDDDFGTIRSLSKLNTLNMAAAKIESDLIPDGAFADMKIKWYVSPYAMTGIGANAFKGCDQLTAITWNSSSVEMPEDVVTDVANPNMLVYAKSLAMVPYALKNVVINGVANNITLTDSAGNNNFYCPEEFTARRISYTHNYQQTTSRGVSQGWETIALPFTVGSITHETKGEITPFSVEGGDHPFWLYELGDNGLKAATQINANIPYLICMPNDDAYGDEYILGGRVTFSAKNAKITSSTGIAVTSGDRKFVPTYQRVEPSSDVYVLNVNEVVGGNPVGSVFVQNLREVRPFEAYSVHSSDRAQLFSVSSLGGDSYVTGINDLILNNSGESAGDYVKVYSLSGALIKQGKREEVLRSLPKGLYVVDGKKIIK